VTLLSHAALAGALLTFVLLLVRPKWGLLGLILMFPFLNNAIPRAGSGLNAETVLFAAALVSVLLRYRPALPPSGVLAPLLVYGLSMIFGFALFAAWFDPALHGGGQGLFLYLMRLKSALWPVLALPIGFAIANDSETRKAALACLGIAAGVAGASALLGVDLSSADEVMEAAADRATGALYLNPNTVGGFLGCFLIVPFTQLMRSDQARPARFVYGVLYLVGIAALVLTKSRGGWLAFLVAHGAWLFLWDKRLLIPAASAFFLIMASAYSLSLLPEALSERITETLTPSGTYYRSAGITGAIDASAGKRVVVHQMGLEMFLDSPLFGHGYHAFSLLDRDYGPKYGIFRKPQKFYTGTSAESMYLRVAVENGVIGLLISAWLAYSLLVWGAPARDPEDRDRHVGIAFIAMFAAVAVNSATQETLYVHEIAIPFWMLSGVAIRATYDRRMACSRAPSELSIVHRKDRLHAGSARSVDLHYSAHSPL
jgi:O-antigen ligase